MVRMSGLHIAIIDPERGTCSRNVCILYGARVWRSLRVVSLWASQPWLQAALKHAEANGVPQPRSLLSWVNNNSHQAWKTMKIAQSSQKFIWSIEAPLARGLSWGWRLLGGWYSELLRIYFYFVTLATIIFHRVYLNCGFFMSVRSSS